jgi:hypothetical protein
MTASIKGIWSGVLGFAICLTLAGTMPAGAVMPHDSHVAQGSTVDVATPVHAQAGHVLQDKMA